MNVSKGSAPTPVLNASPIILAGQGFSKLNSSPTPPVQLRRDWTRKGDAHRRLPGVGIEV
jgi:hypothetical protein